MIQEFNNEFIVIAEDSTNTDLITDLSTIDCFYHVYGERKDINPLIVEYEGNSWEDYPDPNFDPNKVDSDKRNLILDLMPTKHIHLKKLIYIEENFISLMSVKDLLIISC